MSKIHIRRWITLFCSCLVSVAIGVSSIRATEDQYNTIASTRNHHEALTHFLSSKGQSIEREEIYKILYAVTIDKRRIGAAIKIADNLFLTASHILSSDPSKNAIHCYTNYRSLSFTILAQDERNDIALLHTQETDTLRIESLIDFAGEFPETGNIVSYFLLLNRERSKTYETELRGIEPMAENNKREDFYLGRLLAPQGSFTYEIEGFIMPYDPNAIEAHLERNQLTNNPLYSTNDLSSPEFSSLTTVIGYNGASGGGLFQKTTNGYELVGILTASVTERHLIPIPKSPRGFTRLQQNYSLFAHRKAIVTLINDYLLE